MLEPMRRSASISSDGLHRYDLTREWWMDGEDPHWICFCGLNPSTADGLVDDATIRREIDFAKRFGANALIKVNLYSWRATQQADLRRAIAEHGYFCVTGGGSNPIVVRPLARLYPLDLASAVAHAVALARLPGGLGVVAAWGAGVSSLPHSEHLIQRLGSPLFCLGRTKHGYPKHPVRLAKTTRLELYS